MRTWERSTFRRVCVAVLNRFSANTSLEAAVFCKVLDAAGPGTAVVSLHGGPYVQAEAFASYLGSGYQAKLVEYPKFDLWLLKRCLQRTASSVFGSLEPFSLTEFVMNRLKGAETRGWMAPRPALRKAIITNGLSMPGLVKVVANIFGVWHLIVSYLKEIGRKDEGDSLVVRSFPMGILSALYKWAHFYLAVFRRRGWTGTCTMTSSLGWNSGCFISFYKSVSIFITLLYDPYVVVLCYCLHICRNTLVPFHYGSTLFPFFQWLTSWS